MEPVQIVIAADDPLARSGLAMMLRNEPDCEVLGQVDSRVDWASELAFYQPDVILYDVGWQSSELDLDETIGTPLLMLVEDEAGARAALLAGALGVVNRSAESATIVAALHSVSAGLLTLQTQLVADVPFTASNTTALVEPLTERELDVLLLLAEGMTNKAIGVELDVSDNTVKFHVNALLTKLAAQSRTEAVVQAIRAGILKV